MRWYVDGMNVIGTRPDGWWRDRDAPMLRLVRLLENWAAAEGEDVVVVFERPARPPIRSSVIEIASAPKPKADAADDEIVRGLRDEPQPGLGRAGARVCDEKVRGVVTITGMADQQTQEAPPPPRGRAQPPAQGAHGWK